MYKKLVDAAIFAALVTGAQTSLGECDPSVPQSAAHKLTPAADSSALVDDTHTGLTWMRCSLGQTWQEDLQTCINTANKMNWKEALQTALAYEFAGYSNWRLPNKKELASIIEYSCVEPAIDSDIFPNTDNGTYWTSTPNPISSAFSVWAVFFYDGSFSNGMADEELAVRLVRTR